MVKDLKKNTPEATTFGSRGTSWSMIFRCRPRYLYQGGGTKSGAKISASYEGVVCASVCVCVSLCAPMIGRFEHPLPQHTRAQ